MVGGPDFEDQALQPGDPGPPPAGLLDQALHPAHRARTGDLARTPSTNPAPQELPLRQERQGNLRGHQRRGLLPRLLRRSSARRPTPTTRSTPSSALEGLKGKTVARPDPRDRRRRSTRWATTTRSRPTRRWSSAGSSSASRRSAGPTPTSTLGNDGDRVSGTLAPRPGDSPVAYTEVTDQDGDTIKGGDNDSTPRPGDRRRKRPKKRRASSKPSSPAAPAPTPRSAPKASGARRARPRTTATPGSAAATRRSHRLRLGRLRRTRRRRWTTLYNGGPVMGGTFPALIWASVISAWEEIQAEHAAETAAEKAGARKTARSSSAGETESYVRRKPKRESRPNRKRRTGARSRSGAGTRSGARSSGPEAAPEAAPESRRRRRRHHRRASRRGRGRETKRAAGGAEAPGALDRFGDPDPGAGDDLAAARRPRRGRSRNGSRLRSAPLSREADRRAPRSACRGPSRGRRPGRVAAPRARISSRPCGRLQRPDQHRRRLALGFGDGVEQAVDPVGEVDVGAAGRAEEDLGARRSGRRRRGRRGRRARSSRSRRSCRRGPRRGGGSRPGRGRPRGPSGRRSQRPAALGRRTGSGAHALLFGAPAPRPRASVSRALLELARQRRRAGAALDPLRLQPAARAAAPRSRSRRGARSARAAPPGSARRGVLPRSTASRTRPPTIPCASRKGTPLADQQVGDLGRGQHLVAGGLLEPLAVELDPGEHPLGRVEAGLDRVDRVEERLLVLLHVLAVGERQRVHRRRAGSGSRRRRAGSSPAAARPSRGSSSAA